MRLTPLDIRKQEFRKAMRGLDAEEVYAFLSTVGDEYEAILSDNKAFKERLLELDDKVQEYRSMEKNLRNTLLTAERVTVEAKDGARREANLIIKEAQIEAEKALRDIKNQAMKLRQEVSQLRSQRESYLGRMKVIAESLLKFIQSVETDFNEEDEAFQASLPVEKAAEETLLADPPAENGNLFEDKADEAGPPPPVDEPVDYEADRLATPEPAQQEPGIPREMRIPRVADSPGTTRVEVSNTTVTPAPGDARTDDTSPSGSGDRAPTQHTDESPAEMKHAPVPEPGAKSTLADIDAIIERMAQGQKEMLGATRPGISDTVSDDGLDGSQFEPIPPRAAPITTGGAIGSPRPVGGSGELAIRDSDRYRKELADAAIEYTSEVATAIETPAEEVEPNPPVDSHDVPKGTDVTSEMSLDRIRQDLESQMSRAKSDKDR